MYLDHDYVMKYIKNHYIPFLVMGLTSVSILFILATVMGFLALIGWHNIILGFCLVVAIALMILSFTVFILKVYRNRVVVDATVSEKEIIFTSLKSKYKIEKQHLEAIYRNEKHILVVAKYRRKVVFIIPMYVRKNIKYSDNINHTTLNSVIKVAGVRVEGAPVKYTWTIII